MDISQRKEQFNIAYVHAIAAQAGINHSRLAVDDDSIDLMLSGRNFSGKRRNPAIELQLKCTASPKISGGVIKFKLPIKTYDDLRGTNILSPRYLAVLLVPNEPSEWIVHGPECMALHNLCYWVSLRGLPEVNNATKITVDVPLSQRLTTTSLNHLLTLASDGMSA
ncbi:DUF4365 domain-containing protein [Cupriavidus sp.]|uniref:DUF4365 domain-containing protein n=1 Tax=Cupriavidus sp. TaxID=1873897 RepID=UPI0028BD2230|nr:DUF4365 domain-containing protein [Cupriavidus sp.]